MVTIAAGDFYTIEILIQVSTEYVWKIVSIDDTDIFCIIVPIGRAFHFLFDIQPKYNSIRSTKDAM